MPSYRYDNQGCTCAVDPGYTPQPGETVLDHYPPVPGEAPLYDAAQAARDVLQASSALRVQAQALLDKADTSALRALKLGVPVPAGWLAYEEALRVIVRTGTGTIPALPATYPDGTPT
jgi:hypothetical protein